MPEIFELRSRLEGLKGIHNITYAMQIVTISRLKRINAQLAAVSESTDQLKQILKTLLAEDAAFAQRFFSPKLDKEKPPVFVLFFSNRGFCGSFNPDVLNQAKQFCNSNGIDFATIEKVCVGKKAEGLMKHFPKESVRYFQPLKDTYQQADCVKFEQLIRDLMAQSRPIYFVYTRFKSIITQQATVERFYPAAPEAFELSGIIPLGVPFYVDPDRDMAYEKLVQSYYYLRILEALRHSSSSEFSQRFLLMKSAVDNVKGLTDEITLKMNKERQKMITQELSEIVGTFKALKQDRS